MPSETTRAPAMPVLARLPGALALACSLCLLGCGSAAEERENVILIVVDTLRAGRTSLHGYERETTPRIAEWAEGGTVFDRAQAPSSWTVPSMAMLLTGRYRVGGGRSLTKEGGTLCAALSAEGYRTIGIVANPVLNEFQGFDVGYETYDLLRGKEDDTDPLHIGSWTAQIVVAKALRWLREELDEGPFLLYLHLMDPHHPYEPDHPDAFAWRAAKTSERRALYDARLVSTGRDPIHDDEFHTLERLQAAYDAEILQVDQGLGELFDYLESSGLMQSSIVVLTSDHGEGLWQRPSGDGWVNTRRHENQILPELYRGHGEQLYEELLHVPLVFHGPGVPAGRRDARPTSLIDVLPTLFSLLDLSPPEGLQGHALFQDPDSSGHDALFSTCSRGTTITQDGRWKLHLPNAVILARGARPVLFDLESDPLEETPIEDPAREAQLSSKITAWLALHRRDAEELPIEEQRRLILQMGYIGLAADLHKDMSKEEIQRLFKLEREQRKAEAAAATRSED